MCEMTICKSILGRPRKPDSSWSWLVTFTACVNNILHFGFSQSFAVFLPVLSDYFKSNREETAWAGSIAIACTLFVGPFASKLSHKYGQRVVTMVAGFGCAVSLISSSFVNKLPILYVSYGVLFGLCGGTILNTGFTMTYSYFTKKRSLANGIAAAGASMGVIILGPVLEEFIELLSWRGALRVMAGLMLVICILGCTYSPVDNNIDDNMQSESLKKEDVKPHQENSNTSTIMTYLSVFKSLTYTVGLVSVFLGYFGLFVPSIHLVRFAKDLSVSSKNASYLFIAIGICSSLARVLFGAVLDRKWLSPLTGVQIATLLMGIAYVASTQSTNYLHLVVFASGYGIANGIFVTAQVIFLQSSVKPSKSAMGLGMGYCVSSIAVCGGPPFVGFVADTSGSYILSFYVVGGIAFFAAVFPLILILRKFKKTTTKEISSIEVNNECQQTSQL